MNSTPRVLFINHSIRDGGPGRSLFYLLKFLDRKKIAPFVLIPKDDIFSERLKKEGIYENVITDRRFPENLKRPWFSKNGASGEGGKGWSGRILHVLSMFLNILDLTSLIITSPVLMRRYKIDIIYCNGTQAKVAGALMGLINRKPVIWHVRNIQQTRLLGSIINTLAALPSVKRIICVSGAAAAQFRRGRRKLTVIHNGIDVDEYAPSAVGGEIRDAYGLPDGTVIVGSTGRIVPRKGYGLFIEAAASALKDAGNEAGRLRFVIVGDTPYFFEDHLGKLKDIVHEKGLVENFIFTGYREDVRPSLKDFDIFVIPSNYPDPFPRSVIEAMSFGLPVLGFKVGGIVEAVEDGVTGILSEPGDTAAMGRAISKLAGDEALRRSMGKAGRERAIANFSAEAIARRIESEILAVATGQDSN